jgi:Zn-dependent metalloprotease
VVGGDAVVVADGSGGVRDTVAAPTAPITVGTRAEVTADQARMVARAQLDTVDRATAPELVVLAGDTPRLAYEVVVTGRSKGLPSRLHVFVDARTGAVAQRWDEVRSAQPDDATVLGSGTGYHNGSVTIDTSPGFAMRDPNRPGVSCGDNNTKQVFTGPDDVWGNGSGTNLETACVDALYGAQREWEMLRDWLGRNGINGQGGGYPAWVGLNQANAFWNGSSATFGRSSDGQRQATPMDVVAHEFGHAIFQTTPGGSGGGGNEKGGLNESTGDIFGALTEFYANNPNDPPDFLVGEEVNLVGRGPIRNMYNPSALGDPNCYSSSIPSTEVHAAAGPGNHWFYLLAMGSNPTNGQPASTTCNSTTVTGIGMQKAITILYNAMLMKTSASSYLRYRVWTLQAAKNLYPNSCAEFDVVKAAWAAVSVPAQSGEPTCTTSTPTASPTVSPTASPTASPTGGTCSGQKLLNPGFESGATSWTATSGVIGQGGSQAARTGTWRAWLDGYGSSHTDTLSQSVTIPAGCSATLTFYIHIDTAETTTSTQYDKLSIQANSTTLATLSNLNSASGYVQKTYSLSSFAGQTVTIKFTGAEDSSLQTSFVIDDTAVTLG